MMISEPTVLSIQGDQKKIVLLESGDKRGTIEPALARFGIGTIQHIAQRREKRFKMAVSTMKLAIAADCCAIKPRTPGNP